MSSARRFREWSLRPVEVRAADRQGLTHRHGQVTVRKEPNQSTSAALAPPIATALGHRVKERWPPVWGKRS